MRADALGADVTEAMILLGYAVAASWCVPVLLGPLTSRGISPWLGLAAWLTAMSSVVAALVLGAERSVAVATADWPQLTTALCRSVAGGVCTPQVYRSALYEAGVAAFAAVILMLLTTALWRYGSRIQRGMARTRSHARAALLVGREFTSAASTDPIASRAGIAAGAWDTAGDDDGRMGAHTVVLDDPRPAAYCVTGRPAAIVVTTGALAVLEPPQLAAVLSHERAHLAGCHHALLLLTRGLTAAFPGVPLFIRGAAEVARLAEMAADDTASRAHGRHTVVAALLSLATAMARPPTPGPDPGSGPSPSPAAGPAQLPIPLPRPRLAVPAAAYAVPARVERLLRPPRPAAAAAFAIALALALAALAAVPPLLATLIA